VQSRWYRAPEVMLGMPWDEKTDLWSLGCVLAEMIIGQPIFRCDSVEGVLAAIIAVIGAIPSHILEHSPELAGMFLTSTGRAYEIDPPGLAEGAYFLEPLPNKQLCTLILEAAMPSLFGDELEGFISHLLSMLSIDPQARPTAAEAAKHPWLKHSAASSALVEMSLDGVEMLVNDAAEESMPHLIPDGETKGLRTECSTPNSTDSTPTSTAMGSSSTKSTKRNTPATGPSAQADTKLVGSAWSITRGGEGAADAGASSRPDAEANVSPRDGLVGFVRKPNATSLARGLLPLASHGSARRSTQ